MKIGKKVFGKRVPGLSSWFLGRGKEIPDKTAKTDVTEGKKYEKKEKCGVQYHRNVVRNE